MITEALERRGMLDLTPPFARCCKADCGWEGIPIYVHGEAQTECPACEGFPDELDLGAQPLRRNVFFRQRVAYAPGPKVGRNEPCPCGSGKKFKRCCGA